MGVLSLNRPDKAHAYDRKQLLLLKEHINTLSQEASVVVVRSIGHRAFCAGADLSGMVAPDPFSALFMLSQQVFQQLADAPFISIAAVHGAAVAGGCELALACDLRVVAPSARFALPETALGLIPAAGGCNRLVQLIGLSRAKGMILGGLEMSGEEALSSGLAHRLSEDPARTALLWAEQLAERSATASRFAKQVLAHPSLHLERWSEALLYDAKRATSSKE